MSQSDAKKYRFVGSHPDSLANGRPVEPGEYVELTDEDVRDPHNEMLLADGNLIGIDDEAEKQANLADRRVTSRVKRAEEPDDEGEES